MTPLELLTQLREILGEECRCKVCWGQRPHALSADELAAIRSRVQRVIDGQLRKLKSDLDLLRLKSA